MCRNLYLVAHDCGAQSMLAPTSVLLEVSVELIQKGTPVPSDIFDRFPKVWRTAESTVVKPLPLSRSAAHLSVKEYRGPTSKGSAKAHCEG